MHSALYEPNEDILRLVPLWCVGNNMLVLSSVTKWWLSFICFAADSEAPRNLFAVKFQVRLNQAYYCTHQDTVRHLAFEQNLLFFLHPPLSSRRIVLKHSTFSLGSSTYKMVLVTDVHCDFHSFSGTGGLAKCLSRASSHSSEPPVGSLPYFYDSQLFLTSTKLNMMEPGFFFLDCLPKASWMG